MTIRVGTSIEVNPIDAADEDQVFAAAGIVAAATGHDVPDLPLMPRSVYLAMLRHPRPGQLEHQFLATHGGQAVGVLRLELPVRENRTVAGVNLVVHPRWRRQGIGRALAAHAARQARQRGRHLLMGQYVQTLPGGPPRPSGPEAFALALGAESALPEVRRCLDLEAATVASWDKLRETARPASTGYTLVRWRDPATHELATGMAALESRLLRDAPLGSLRLEPEDFDTGRIRAGEDVARLRGQRFYHAGALDDATGQLAAWTAISVDHDVPTHGWQQTTIVDPAHRGHRLGLLTKIDNLEQTIAHEPALVRVNTWNATVNHHMIAINEALGFRPVDAWMNWQLDIG